MSEEFVARPEPLRGYRELTDEERELVDAIKVAEQAVGQVWARAKRTLGTDARMHAHSRTVLQDGFMWLERSVTRPRDVFTAALSTLDGPEGPPGTSSVEPNSAQPSQDHRPDKEGPR